MATTDRKFTTTILIKKEGQIPPKELLECLMKHHPSGMGMAFVNDRIVRVGTMIGKRMPDIKSVMQGMDQTKNLSMLLSFHNFPQDASPEDYQPFEVTTDKTVACVVDGEFVEFTQAKSKRSNQFFFLQELIIPKFTQLKRLCKDDMEAVMEEIKQSVPIMTKELLTKGKRSIVSIMSTYGPVVTLTLANDKAHEAEWGYVSNVFDWKAPVTIKETSEKIEAPTNLFLEAMGTTEKDEDDEENNPFKDTEEETKQDDDDDDEDSNIFNTEVKEEEVKEEKKPETETITTKDADETNANLAEYEIDMKREMVRCTPKITSKSGRKRWHRANLNGNLPTDYEDRPWRDISQLGKNSPVLKAIIEKGLGKDLKSLPKVIRSLKDIPTDVLASRPSVTKDNKTERPTKDAPVPKKTPDESPAEIPDDMPIIGIAGRKLWQEVLSKTEFRDTFGRVIPDPKTVQSKEKESGTFMSQLGVQSLEETLDMPIAFLREIARADVDLISVLCRTLMNRIIILQDKKEDNVIDAFTRKAG